MSRGAGSTNNVAHTLPPADRRPYLLFTLSYLIYRAHLTTFSFYIETRESVNLACLCTLILLVHCRGFCRQKHWSQASGHFVFSNCCPLRTEKKKREQDEIGLCSDTARDVIHIRGRVHKHASFTLSHVSI